MVDPIREILAANIKRYRQALGFSQMKLAEKAGISTSLVASIETGKKFPSSTSLNKLRKAFNVEIHQLFLPETDSSNQNSGRYMKYGKLRSQLKKDIREMIDSRFQEFLTKKEK